MTTPQLEERIKAAAGLRDRLKRQLKDANRQLDQLRKERKKRGNGKSHEKYVQLELA